MSPRRAITATAALAASPVPDPTGVAAKVAPVESSLAASEPAAIPQPSTPAPEPEVSGSPSGGNGHAATDAGFVFVEPAAADILLPPAEPKKRGRPRKVRALNPEPPSATPPGIGADILSGVNYRAIANALVQTVTGAATTLIGPEWQPEKHEAENLTECTAVFLKANNWSDIPPGWMLLLALAGYALPRLVTENTQAKIAKARGMLLGR